MSTLITIIRNYSYQDYSVSIPVGGGGTQWYACPVPIGRQAIQNYEAQIDHVYTQLPDGPVLPDVAPYCGEEPG